LRVDRRHALAALVVAVTFALAGVAGTALWQAASAEREVKALRLQVDALQSRLLGAQGTDEDAEEAAAKAERNAEDALEKATAVDRRVRAALRELRKQISSLKAASETTSDVRECGNKPAGGAWTYEQVQGAGHFNLTARNVSCADARDIVDQITFETDPPYEPQYPGWSCTYVRQEFEFSDIRCTSGSKVIRWQSGA
jgi:hypothetical protein